MTCTPSIVWLPLLAACSNTLQGDDTAVEASGVSTGELNEHCGTIDGDTTWAGDRTHLVTCTVEVTRGTLTIEAGAIVQFAPAAGLRIGTDQYEASLNVEGTADAPVIFEADGGSTEPGAWKGVRLESLAHDSVIRHAELRYGSVNRNGAIQAVGADVLLDDVLVLGGVTCGLDMEEGAGLTDGSTALTVSETEGWPVCIDAARADSLPDADSAYTGSSDDGIRLHEGVVTTSATWVDLGVPYVVSVNLEVYHSADTPAVLTLGPGVTLQVETNRAINIADSDAAGGLVANGTEDAPVTITALGSDSPGYWKGVQVASTASQGDVRLTHTAIEYAGYKRDAALAVEGVGVLLDHVTVRGSSSAGIALSEGASFDQASTDLTIQGCDHPMQLSADAIGGLPLDGLDIGDNTTDTIVVARGGDITTSATWRPAGVAYMLEDSVYVEGTADEPTVLTLAAGTEIRVGANRGLFIAKRGGAAALVVEGTASDPVVFNPWDAYEPGNWAGIGIYGDALDDQTVLAHVEVGYGGGRTLQGSIHLVDASPTIRDAWLHDSAEWGLYCSGDCAPVTSGLTFDDNAEGECSPSGMCGD